MKLLNFLPLSTTTNLLMCTVAAIQGARLPFNKFVVDYVHCTVIVDHSFGHVTL